MKNLNLLSAILLFCFFNMLFCYGQSVDTKRNITKNYDPQEAELVANSLKRKSKYARTKKLIAISIDKLDPFFISRNGSFAELVSVDELGNPIYYESTNSINRGIIGIESVQQKVFEGITLLGQDMEIGLWDGTLPYKEHREFENIPNRILYKNAYPDILDNRNQLWSYQYRQQHATHIAGTIGAYGVNPQSKGVGSDYIIHGYDWLDDTIEMHYAAQNGLLVSNHSYGLSFFNYFGSFILDPKIIGAYYGQASDIDRITYAAPKYQPVVSAGNNRDEHRRINKKNGFDILVNRAVAKNIITVGNIDRELNNGQMNIEISSSFGPTKDFRIKPDIAAPGTKVYSSLSPNTKETFDKKDNQVYGELTGTSMAAPLVAATIGLWQQWCILNTNNAYDSATMRAIMANSATKMTHYNGELLAPGPNPIYGWGMINAAKGLDILERSYSETIVIERTLNNQEESLIWITGKDIVKNLKATLSWTDPAGEVSMSDIYYEIYKNALVNDLDMRIVSGTKVYSPWYLNKDFNNLKALKGDNNVDNIEQIEEDLLPTKTFLVRITHKGTLVNDQQRYSLVVTADTPLKLTKVTFPIGTKESKASTIKPLHWPNPVETTLNIQTNLDTGIHQVLIYNNTGKLVLNQNLQAIDTVLQVDCSHLIIGSYIVKVINEIETKEFLIIKK